MKKDNKQRLFEVMERLDKTFKPKLNENKEQLLNHFINFWSKDKYLIDKINHNPELKNKYSKYLNLDINGWNALSEDELKYIWNEWNIDAEKYGDSDIFRSNNNDLFEDNVKSQLPVTVDSDNYLEITTPVGSEDDKLFVGVVNQGIDSHLEGFTKSNFDVRRGSLGNRRMFNFHKSELPILLRRLENVGTEEALLWKDDIENYDNTLNELIVGNNRSNEINSKYNNDKKIVIAYQTITPESAEQGDYADHGWKNEEGESMIPDEYETEEGITAIDKAVEFLRNNGSVEPSSSQFHSGVWYSTIDPDRNYKTGEEKYYSFHLKNFTPEEEQEIYNNIKKR